MASYEATIDAAWQISREDRAITLEAATALLVARDTITVTGRQRADLENGAPGRPRVSYQAEVRLRGPARQTPRKAT